MDLAANQLATIKTAVHDNMFRTMVGSSLSYIMGHSTFRGKQGIF